MPDSGAGMMKCMKVSLLGQKIGQRRQKIGLGVGIENNQAGRVNAEFKILSKT